MTKAKEQTAASNKKSKGSTGPKRPRSAYILFSIEKREQNKKENPSSPKLTLADIGAHWKAADRETKQRFQKLADAEKHHGGQQSNSSKPKQSSNSNKKNQSNDEDNDQTMELNSP